MKKLDIVHHKFLMTLLIVIVLLIGVFFGVRLSTVGMESMQVFVFALVFLNTILLYVVFTQILHVRDDIEKSRRKKK